MSRLERDWGLARAKVEEEGCCRVCGSTSAVQAAHIIGRERDGRDIDGHRPKGKIVVDPDSIVPLCGPHPVGCHGDYDRHELDLLPYLTPREQVAAVIAAQGIWSALRRLSPEGAVA